MDTLIILDLDHTLIFGSYAMNESSMLLLQYNEYLKVYERPFVREFINKCKAIGDIVVCTTSKKDYATKICEALVVEPMELLSRNDCLNPDSTFVKRIKPEWYHSYREIFIVDDSPDIWQQVDREKVSFIDPGRFMGDANDYGLKKCCFF